MIWPKSSTFEIIFGAELNEKTIIPPGLFVRIVVRFKPISEISVNDVLTILVDNDGALLVPLLTSSESPILESKKLEMELCRVNFIKLYHK